MWCVPLPNPAVVMWFLTLWLATPAVATMRISPLRSSRWTVDSICGTRPSLQPVQSFALGSRLVESGMLPGQASQARWSASQLATPLCSHASGRIKCIEPTPPRTRASIKLRNHHYQHSLPASLYCYPARPALDQVAHVRRHVRQPQRPEDVRLAADHHLRTGGRQAQRSASRRAAAASLAACSCISTRQCTAAARLLWCAAAVPCSPSRSSSCRSQPQQPQRAHLWLQQLLRNLAVGQAPAHKGAQRPVAQLEALGRRVQGARQLQRLRDGRDAPVPAGCVGVCGHGS
jgi:hypothetical protein